ncbi:hypothetical protein WG902_13215 [Ramlibacter sp. PS3R-8]|uniref:hypothetical protein n=1 Tax=Ramlibacter sp. PS3R-8 TaxID=3133437 RepID=UPI00309B21FD
MANLYAARIPSNFMRSPWRVAMAVAFVAVVGGRSMPATAGPAATLAELEYAEAVQTFRAGRTSVAFGQFMALAKRGDVDSARITLFLHAYGPVLYGKQWDVMPSDLDQWNTLVRNSTTTARAMPDFPLTVMQPSKPRSAAAAVRATAVKNVKAN